MLVIMRHGATSDQIDTVVDRVKKLGCEAVVMHGDERVGIGVKTPKHNLEPSQFEDLPGVLEAKRVSKPYKLASREFHESDSFFSVGNTTIGNGHFTVIAGPCAIESEDQLMAIASFVERCGATLLRGGAVKPRSSPYSFRGLGEEGFRLLRKAGDKIDLPVISEVMRITHIKWAKKHGIDILQIGARNMQNFDLLEEASRAGKPVLLKRGMSATLEDLLQSAEYLLAGGCEEVVLCLRGIRTFEGVDGVMRNTPDLGIIPALKKMTHLPIIFDPSHACGHTQYVPDLASMALAGRAHGIMVETHNCPECALCDGAQSLNEEQFEQMMSHLKNIAPMFNMQMAKNPVIS